MTGKAPVWFVVAAIVAILFELVGVAGYVVDIMQTPADIARLPIDQQMLWSRIPRWIYVAYAVATFAGLAGAIALLLRRRWSIPLLGLSLLAAIVQFGGYFLLPQLRGLQSPRAMLVPVVVIAICAATFGLSQFANRRGWLR